MKSPVSTVRKSSRKSVGAGAKRQKTEQVFKPQETQPKEGETIKQWVERSLHEIRDTPLKERKNLSSFAQDLLKIVEDIGKVKEPKTPSQEFEELPVEERRQKITDFIEKHKPDSPAMRYKDGNPKTEFGAVKPGVFYTPPIPLYEYSLAHYQGALKYGHYNWRDDPISISTYTDAAIRHINLFLAGQKNASDTGIHHLGHAMTCLSIIIDAEAHSTLIDNRHVSIQYARSDQPGIILEGYMEETKNRVQKINQAWTGHAEAVKAGPDAYKAWKESKQPQTKSANIPIGRYGQYKGRWGKITGEFFGFENDRRPYFKVKFNDDPDERSVPQDDFIIDHGH